MCPTLASRRLVRVASGSQGTVRTSKPTTSTTTRTCLTAASALSHRRRTVRVARSKILLYSSTHFYTRVCLPRVRARPTPGRPPHIGPSRAARIFGGSSRRVPRRPFHGSRSPIAFAPLDARPPLSALLRCAPSHTLALPTIVCSHGRPWAERRPLPPTNQKSAHATSHAYTSRWRAPHNRVHTPRIPAIRMHTV